MKRYRSSIKETYQQVSETEFNEVNPYAVMIGSIRNEYPNAIINKAKTWCDVIGSLSIPFLTIWYDTGEANEGT